MNKRIFRANTFLFLCAAIWGLAFVAQRVATGTLGNFTFNGIRFLLGGLSMVPLILLDKRKESFEPGSPSRLSTALIPGLIAGVILFIAAALQQVGLVGTTAGKAAFITGLYIVLIPLAGIFLKHKMGLNSWVGAGVATLGLYLLSITADFNISGWDLLELIGAFFWTAHILIIGYYTQKVSILRLAIIQYLVTGVLSLVVAFFFEPWDWPGIQNTLVPILYGGFGSVGIAYTLQILGQRDAPPAAASLILSLETVFAALAGWFILGEVLGGRELLGAGLMFAGMVVSQWSWEKKHD